MELLPISAVVLGASTKSSGSSLESLLPFAGILLVGYFLIIRPRQARARKQRTAVTQLAIGDDVVSIGGIYGRIVDLNETDVQVEVSPGVVMTFLRRAVNPRIDPRGPPASASSPADPDDGQSDPPEWDESSGHGFGVPSQDPLDAPPVPRDHEDPPASASGPQDGEPRPDHVEGGEREGR